MDKQVFRKNIDLKLAKELVLQAIHAEWAKDFKAAASSWGLAQKVCSLKGETWCKNRRELCNILASREDLEVTMTTPPPSIFDALKF